MMGEKVDLAIAAHSAAAVWTPTAFFDNPGTSSLSIHTNNAVSIRNGNLVTIAFNVVVTITSKGSGSGKLNIGGLPYSISNYLDAAHTLLAGNAVGSLVQCEGFTWPASYTQAVLSGSPGTTWVFAAFMGSGQSQHALQASDLTNGNTVALVGSVSYFTTDPA